MLAAVDIDTVITNVPLSKTVTPVQALEAAEIVLKKNHIRCAKKSFQEMVQDTEVVAETINYSPSLSLHLLQLLPPPHTPPLAGW